MTVTTHQNGNQYYQEQLMYLSNLFIENFRIFGSEKDSKHLDLNFKPGMNVLVGENDSGKSAIVDAVRIVLRTSSNDYYRLSEDDFHLAAAEDADSTPVRAPSFTIRCTFSVEDTSDIGRYLEWLSIDENGNHLLIVTFQAERRDDESLQRHRFPYRVYSGHNAEGPRIEGNIREFLRVTYLKPLRDAEAELAPGRGSRLSQILANHPGFKSQEESDFDPQGPLDQSPETLVGILRQAEYRIEHNYVVGETREELNQSYLGELSLNEDNLQAAIGVTRETSLRQILEKLELWLEPEAETGRRTRRGLGFNNALFMAAELLLLGEQGSDSLPLLLIEEPEAHLHPQMQLRLMSFLDSKSRRSRSPAATETEVLADSESEEASDDAPHVTRKGTQILVTTHSPNLASKAKLENLILMHRGAAYPLDKAHTSLASADYRFLERFLDVTKANLFFAKAVLMVEGDAENILVPVVAEILGRSFSKYGVSVVNVGHTGLFRYARILQSSQTSTEIPIRVACLADRDIVPDSAANFVSAMKKRKSQLDPTEVKKVVAAKKKADGGRTKTFVSPHWTLEYDLAVSGLAEELHASVKIAKKESYRDRNSGTVVSDEERKQCQSEAVSEIATWKDDGKDTEQIAALIYRDLYARNASKAITAQNLADSLLSRQWSSPNDLRQKLPQYLIDAIEYLTEPGL